MNEKFTIAVIAPAQPEDFCDLLWEGVWEATFDIADFGVTVQNFTTDGFDANAQLEILGNLGDEIDAVALLPVHSTLLNERIDYLAARDIPVITLLADAPASRRAAFVGTNPFQAGALAGEVLAKLMRGRGRVVSIPGPLESFHAAGRYRGFLEHIARYGIEERSVAVAPSSDGHENVSRELMEALRNADGVFAGTAETPPVGPALELLGTGIPCVGFSNTKIARRFLRSGAVAAVIDESRYQQGYFAVQQALKAILKKQERAALKCVQVPSTVIFASNIGEDDTDAENSLNTAFETLVRQRTEILCSYKARLEAANIELRNLSITDSLTGLLNRRRFEEVLQQEVGRSRRYGPFSLLLIDIDYFKLINDRYGHPAGDAVLKAVAGVLQSTCRATDVCARLGGDEFAVVLPQTDENGAGIVRERILEQAARATVLAGDARLTFMLSIGRATSSTVANTAEDMIAAADAAMYRVKEVSHSGARAEDPVLTGAPLT